MQLVESSLFKFQLASSPGETRAIADMEFDLVPGPIAEREPVGKGWEEPNNSPFLDGNDKQIKMHSSRVNIDGALKVLGDLASGALFLAKLIIAGKIIAAILGGVLSLLLIYNNFSQATR